MFIFLEIANWSKIRVLQFIKFDSKNQSHTKFSTIVFLKVMNILVQLYVHGL